MCEAIEGADPLRDFDWNSSTEPLSLGVLFSLVAVGLTLCMDDAFEFETAGKYGLSGADQHLEAIAFCLLNINA